MIRIKKAKLSKSGTLEVNYIDEFGNDVMLKGKNVVHDDLKERLANLVPHLATLTEQSEAPLIDWDTPTSPDNREILRHLEVTGVTLNEDELSPIAVLIGKRTLLTSKVLNICAPATGLNSDDEDYMHVHDFRDAVKAFIFEAEQYVIAHKWAYIQQEIEFNTEAAESDPFTVDSPDEVELPTEVA